MYKVKLIQVEKYNKAKESERAEIETNPQKIFLTALDNVKPLLKVIPLVKSGISYQVPVPMTEKEREFKASKLLIETCLDKERSMRFYDRLAIELIDAYQNQVIKTFLKFTFYLFSTDFRKNTVCFFIRKITLIKIHIY